MQKPKDTTNFTAVFLQRGTLLRFNNNQSGIMSRYQRQKQRFDPMAALIGLVMIYLPVLIGGQTIDRFNYVSTKNNGNSKDYGPSDWKNVKCPNINSCVRFLVSNFTAIIFQNCRTVHLFELCALTSHGSSSIFVT
jgi:hypothetical protein